MAQIKKEEIKNQILDAALYLFAKNGYRETSISDIAKRAEISVGNVYRYYKSKIEVFKEVVPEEFVLLAKDMVRQKMYTGKANTVSEQLDSEIYQKNSEQFMKELIKHRLQILAFTKCQEDELYVTYQEELLDCIVQSFLDGFIANAKEREEKRKIVTSLYRGCISLCTEILAEDADEQTLMEELRLVIRYHVSGLASLAVPASAKIFR